MPTHISFALVLVKRRKEQKKKAAPRIARQNGKGVLAGRSLGRALPKRFLKESRLGWVAQRFVYVPAGMETTSRHRDEKWAFVLC